MKLEGPITSRDVLKRTAERQLGTSVEIEDEFVYVLNPDKSEWTRYAIPEHTRLVLEALDRGETITEGIAFELIPPSSLG